MTDPMFAVKIVPNLAAVVLPVILLAALGALVWLGSRL